MSLLADEARAQPTVDVRFGSEIVGLRQDSESVQATVRSADGSERTVSAKYLVGCDGGGSFVRKALGIGNTGQPRAARYMLIFFRCPGLLKKTGLDAFRHYYIAGERGGLLIPQDDLQRWAFTWDGSQDRLAVVSDPNAPVAAPNSAGFHHAAYEVENLSELIGQYRALKEQGIVPEQCLNHGVATSMYYRDPDHNLIELTVGSFKTVDDLNEWLATGALDINPLGVFLDPEELAARVDSGEPEEEILKPHPQHTELRPDLPGQQLPRNPQRRHHSRKGPHNDRCPGQLDRHSDPGRGRRRLCRLSRRWRCPPGRADVFDVFGLRGLVRDMADRLASSGYTVLAPNIFYRLGRAPVIISPDQIAPDDLARYIFEVIMPQISGLTPELVMRDTGAYLDWLAASEHATGGPVGVTGYCMGVPLMMHTAGTYPDRVAAGAGFHGGFLAIDAPNSPHLLAGAITAELYFGHADKDEALPPEQIERLNKALDSAGVRYRAEVYAGAPHGYTQADFARFGRYNAEATDRHWRELVTLFDRTLR